MNAYGWPRREHDEDTFVRAAGWEQASDSEPASGGGPRLLSGLDRGRPMPLREHLRRHGPLPHDRLGRAERDRLIAEVERSGLRGRGGASFPTGRKLRAVTERRGRPVVVANGAEGEPASSKDALLLAAAPQLVLDGAAIAAQAVGAREAVVCVGRQAAGGLAAVRQAIEERRRARLDRVELTLAATPSRYLAGEESALVHWLNGGPAKPTAVPPRPFERGVRGRPTLVQNVETLAQLALIARQGADWFRSAGTAAEPGTALVTLSGAVARPGVYEIAFGTPLRQLLAEAGGVSDEVQAFLIGGYFGSWLSGEAALPLPLAESALRPHGCALGAGAIVALPSSRCGLVESARIVRYLAAENAGQCGPCVHGLAAIAEALALAAGGNHEPSLERRLLRWSGQVAGRGACHHPDGAARLVESVLRTFPDELERHRRRGPCRAARESVAARGPIATAGKTWR